jgi:hypothetical protein
MGFACCGPADSVTVALPSAISLASNPMRRATGTSFIFALVLKSDSTGHARPAHDFFVLPLNSFARTLVSKYSSR